MVKFRVISNIILLFLILISTCAYSCISEPIDTLKIHRKSRWVQKKYARHPSMLAMRLTRNYEDDASKVIAITYWIAKNIKYDLEAYQKGEIFRKNSKEVLKKKKALCGEYAILFNEMCEASGIHSERINGYTKAFDLFPEDKLYRDEHAWSIVNIDNRWELMDITWGSGHLKPKKQYLAKLLWLLFTRPYEIKWKFVKEYNKNWFYVPPQSMIHTHFPSIKAFQLLKDSVPIEAYISNSFQLNKEVETQYFLNAQYPELEHYFNKNKTKRLQYEAHHGYKLNPANHRIKGFNYYLIAKELMERYYDPKKKELIANKKQIANLERYYTDSDTLIKMSIVDNDNEYETYSNRSVGWKEKLKKANKLHVKDLNKRKKLNLDHNRLISITTRNNKSISKNVSKSNKLNTYSISNTRKPRTEKKSNDSLAITFLKKADSLLKINEYLISNKDSLISIYPIEKQIELIKLESSLLNIHKNNFKELKAHVKNKKRKFPWIYKYEQPLVKKWFSTTFQKADSLNRTNIDVCLNDLYSNQKEWYKIMKVYSKNSGHILKLIKKAKKTTIEDHSEDDLFMANLNNYSNEWERYKYQTKNYLIKKSNLPVYYKKENKYFKQCKNLFKKDEKLEYYRHKIYKGYRLAIKRTENNRMRFVLKSLNTIKKEIDKSRQQVELITLSNNDIDEMLSAHNKYRKELGLPPLKWSKKLASSAKEWAIGLGKKGMTLEHSTNEYGENLAYNSGYSESPSNVVDRWALEKNYFDYDAKKCIGSDSECGHYTQIIWKNTKHVGCAIVQRGDQQIWVCQYDPPGNVYIDDISISPY